MIGKYLLRLYRALIPAWLRLRVPQNFKDDLRTQFTFVSHRETGLIQIRHAAKAAEKAEDWKRATELWQLLAIRMSITNRAIQDGTLLRQLLRAHDLRRAKADPHDLEHMTGTERDAVIDVAPAPETPEMRRARFARTGLLHARVSHALALHHQGQQRYFREQLSRAIEALPDQRVLKNDPAIIEALRCHVSTALDEDGLSSCAPDPARQPQRIAICLDVLKLSGVHTHTRVVLAICRSLLQLDPALEMHVIVTNERFVVNTPILHPSFDPRGAADLHAAAQASLPEYYGTRFHLHILRSEGLSGLVATCRHIIGIAPDVMLYGGGHKGFYSNESRVVRHCLYNHFPTAFFFIQSNNEVDAALDMIIARGEYAIQGDPGAAVLRVQPYPTMIETRIETVINPDQRAGKIIVSAMTGVRMDLRLAEQSGTVMRRLLSILDRNPGAVWHFIGASNPEQVLQANPLLAERARRGQVIVHPVLPLENFSALVGSAALFLHLPGFTGGSGGAGIARRAGVPILTFWQSDVAGRQPDGTIFEPGDTAGFVEMGHRLLNDPALWEDVVQRQFAHMRWILEHSAQGFQDCLHEAYRIGAGRIASAHPASPVCDPMLSASPVALHRSG